MQYLDAIMLIGYARVSTGEQTPYGVSIMSQSLSQQAQSQVTGSQPVSAPVILRLAIKHYRGIKALAWRPGTGLNLILGGGDVGKTTILDAVALLLSPTNPATLSDTDYYGRKIEEGFEIEAVMTLPPESGIDYQFKPSWPWEWNGTDAVVPNPDGEAIPGDPVYRLRVRGTQDLELIYEILQPDDTPDALSAGLRREIGLVRLGGDDRNDRDLRLVQGSALDRLLSDKPLRSRMATALAKTDIASQLADERKKALTSLDGVFAKENLPHGLDLSIIGGQGASIASMVGLTATRETVQLPLANWGAGTRRLSALAIAEQNQGQAPVTVVDEVERGLEPYRQEVLIKKLQKRHAQTFATTHSPFVIASAADAAFWYVDHSASIGQLDGSKIANARTADPRVFLSRLSVIAEGATEVGFVTALLERTLGAQPEALGIHVCDGGANETTLGLLEALSEGGLHFAGFADNENTHPTRWAKVADKLGSLLLRWPTGCIEENIIDRVPDEKLEALVTDPDDNKTGMRLRTLAVRLGIENKDFATLSAAAKGGLRALIIQAATGYVPPKKTTPKSERKIYEKHAQDWFKTLAGGRELEAKLFSLDLWPKLKDQLLPFVNAVRKALGLTEIQEVQP